MAFLFRLETVDGVPADPPKIESAIPNWRAGDTIPLGAKTLRVSTFATTRPTTHRSWSSRRWSDERLARRARPEWSSQNDRLRSCP